jgi:transcriptional regulator with XRE-family HTH domain
MAKEDIILFDEDAILPQFRSFVKQRFLLVRPKTVAASKLSVALGQCPQYLNQIENGHKMPSLEGLYRFCTAMGISLADFFDEDGNKYPMEYKELITHLNKLNSEELNEILAVAKRYAIKK